MRIDLKEQKEILDKFLFFTCPYCGQVQAAREDRSNTIKNCGSCNLPYEVPSRKQMEYQIRQAQGEAVMGFWGRFFDYILLAFVGLIVGLLVSNKK